MLKWLQILLFVLGLIALIIAGLFLWPWDEPCVALVLWRAGLAILVVDVVLILLWPPWAKP